MDFLSRFPRRSEDVAFRIIDGVAIIVDTAAARVYTLSRTGTTIWEQADGKTDLEGIVRKVCDTYDVNVDHAKKDAIEFVGSMAEKGLLVLGDHGSKPEGGDNRGVEG